MSPFHVLLLAGGDTSRKKQSNNNIDDDEGGNNVDDYITCRNKFQKEKATSYQTSMSDRSGVNYDTSHNLEIAMAVCCERIPRKADEDGTQDEPSHQSSSSSIHRPVFPANYTAPATVEKDNFKEGRRKTKQGIKTEPSTTSKKVYVIRSGQEWHFLKLLVMYCPKHAVGHRALAMEILQQTAEWELKEKSLSTPDLAASSTYTKGDGQHAPKEEILESGGVQAERIMSFLTAGKYASFSFSSWYNILISSFHYLILSSSLSGGMKLMAKWLVESFTAVPATALDKKSGKQQQHGAHVASPTGCLLLPILHFLKAIPFDKQLVVSTQIHKSIKRLKKALGKLVEGLNPNTLQGEVHPISGGLSVGKVIEAVDNVMGSWSASFAAKNKETHVKCIPFEDIKTKIQQRFDTLSKEHDVGTPMWLPKPVLGSPTMVPKRDVVRVREGNAMGLSPDYSREIKVVGPLSKKRKVEVLPLSKLAKIPPGHIMPKRNNQKQVRWAENNTVSTFLAHQPVKEEEREALVSDSPTNVQGKGETEQTAQTIMQQPQVNDEKDPDSDSDMEDLF